MKQSDFVKAIARNAGLPETAVRATLRGMEDVLRAVLIDGNEEKVATPFGTFVRKESTPRTGRNPQNGKSVDIPGRVAVGFKPAPALKRDLG